MLSIITGIPASLAILTISGIFINSLPGLPTSSPNIHLVFSCIAFLNPSVSLGLTKVALMPNLGRVKRKRFTVPPYN